MKRRKLFLCLVIGLVLSLCMAVFTACDEAPASKIIIEQKVASTAELGTYITVPTAYAVDENDQRIDDEVDIKVVNPHGIIVATSVIDIKAKICGNYKITYSYKDAEAVTYAVKVQDTTGPIVTAKDIFYNPYLNEEVRLFDVKMDDLSGVDNEQTEIKIYHKETGEEYPITQMRTFFPDKTGIYVYSVTAVDSFGNETVKEWEVQIYDRTFTDESATGMMIASFDTPEYVNVFGSGTVTDMAGNIKAEILDEYDGFNGVAKIDLEYFNHNFGYYSSFNLIFPTGYTYKEGTRVAIKIKAEDTSFNNNMVSIFNYEFTHHPIHGQVSVGNGYVKEGEWTTIILEPSVLKQLKETDGTIKGVQLSIKRSESFTETFTQTFYIASITEIETLSAPQNLRKSGNKVVWDAIDGASKYSVSLNGEQIEVNTAECDLPSGGYTVKVKAIGDGVFYEDSVFSAQLTNRVGKPTDLVLEENTLKWKAVSNAVGYVVDINGTQTDVGTATSIAWDKPQDTNYIVKVKAKGDGSVWYDSEEAGMAIRYLAQPEGYVADFSDELYEYDVFNMNVSNEGMYKAADYKADYLPTYEGANGVLKIQMVAGAQGWAVIALKLPETLSLDTLWSLSIKFRLEGVENGAYKGLRIYGRSQIGEARSLCPALDGQLDAWYTANITQDYISTGFGGSSTSDYLLFGVALMTPGTEFNLYLDEITETRREKLATPQNVQVKNGVLTWDQVENATGYIVIVNGQEYEVNTNSYTLPEGDYTATVKATAPDYIQSNESAAMSKRQEYFSELAAELADGELAKYNDERYLYLVENKAFNGQNINFEIIDDEKGEKGKVLHISGTGGYNQIILHLPKTINGDFTLEYRMKATATAGISNKYYWEVMTASKTWAEAWRGIDVDEWTAYEINAKAYGYIGSDKIIIGTQNITTFDLYISVVTEKVDPTEKLKAELGENELARFDRAEYVEYVKHLGPNTMENFKVEIIDDEKGEKGKVLHISGKSVLFNKIEISLLAPTTSALKFDYRMKATVPTGYDGNQYWEVMAASQAWTGVPMKGVNIDDWTTYEVKSWYGYAGMDKIYIGLANVTTFDLYISIIYDVPA